MRKMIIYLLAFIVLCSLANYSINYSIEKEIERQSPYYLCFASIGAISLESRLDCWAKIKSTATSQELKQNVFNLLQDLNLPVKPEQLYCNNTESATLLSLNISQQNEIYTVIAGSDSRRDESYYNITIVSKKNNACLKEFENQLKNSSKFEWTCYYQYTGLLPEALGKESREKLLDVVMQNLKAQEIEVYEDSQLTSMTGYSKVINRIVPCVSVSGKKYNVQTALRTDPQQAQTFVYIASPLILGDY